MNPQRIIEETRERESEFFYRMAQHMRHRADELSDLNAADKAYACREAADFLEQAGTALWKAAL